MAMMIENRDLGKLPKEIQLILSLLILGTILIGGSMVSFLMIGTGHSILSAFFFGLIVSTLLSIFLAWVILSTIRLIKNIFLEENEITFVKSNGKKFSINYDKIIGFADTEKTDTQTGKPLWTVLYVGKSMWSAHHILLTYENGLKFKEYLDKLGVEYRINP